MPVLKKVISLIIVLSILSCFFVYADSPQNIVANSLGEDDVTTEIEFLKAIGIINEKDMGTYEPANGITRAEFCYMVVKMSGLTEGIAVPEQGTGFKDVEASHWTAPYIYAGLMSGIISNSNDGMFNPEQPVLYEHAIKMLISVLGYDIKASMAGGYPLGYIMEARDKRITLPVSIGAELKKSDVAKMTFNAIDVPILIQESFGNENIKYNSYDNRTLLSENLSIYKNEGVLYDDGITRLNGKSNINKKELSIKSKDGIIFTYDIDESLDRSFLLGNYIICYYKTDKNNNDEKQLIYMYPDKQNITLKIKIKDIKEYTNNTYTYMDEKDNIQTVSLSSEHDVIYNGKVFLPSSNEDMIPNIGNVTLLDNDNNGTYDIAFINDYKIVCVDSINKETKDIKDKYGLYSINLDNDNVMIYKEGVKAKFNDISKLDILSVAESKGVGKDKITKVFISSKYKDGRLTERGSEGTIYIDDEEYELADNLKTISYILDTLDMDKSYSFLLDINGEIAGIQEDIFGRDDYIFMKDIASKSKIGNEIKIKAMTQKGMFEILESAREIRINGKSLTNASDLNTLLGDEEGKIKPQLLKIKRNAEGKVMDIYSANSSMNELKLNKLGKAKFKDTNKIFDGIFAIDMTSTVYYIPNENSMDDEDLFAYKTADDLINGDYTFKAYDIDDKGVAKGLVVSGDAAQDFGNDDFVGVVQKRTNVIDDKGEIATRIYLLQKNEEKSYLLDKHVTHVGNRPANELNIGDVFRYQLDPAKNTISRVSIHLDYSKRHLQIGEAGANNHEDAATAYSNLLRFVYGDVVSKDGNRIKVRIKKAEGLYENYYFSMARANMSLCKIKGEDNMVVSEGEVSDIQDFETTGDWDKTSKVLMRQRYGEVMDAVIYNSEN